MAYLNYDEPMRLTFGDVNGVLYATEMAWDYYSDDLEYLSFVSYKTTIDEIVRQMKMNDNITIRVSGGYCYKRKGQKYHMEVSKTQNSDMYHAVITAKDYCKTEEHGESWTMYFYVDAQDANKEARLKELLLDKLNKYSSVPLLPEWIDYIYYALEDDMRMGRSVVLNGSKDIETYRLVGTQRTIKEIIETGLSNGSLNINGSNEPSVLLDESTGLNSYLSLFGSLLADKIQTKFKPKFVPGTDMYSNALMTLDDYIHCKGIELYIAQMSVIQACANNFDINKYGIICGEMGAGKSIQAASTCYVHHNDSNKGFNAIIMCPSHLVEKWKSETETYIPHAKGYIVHNLDELLAIESKLRNRNRTENMFVIMSKEIAKLGYDERPAVIWSKSKKCFVCPECGRELFKWGKHPVTKQKVKYKLKELDFTKQYAHNIKCSHEDCNAKLWTTLNRDEEDNGWIKLGDQGWIRKDHIPSMTEKLMNKERLDKKETDLFNKLFEQYERYQEGEEYKNSYRGSKKYPVAKYIYKRMDNVFDYTILDESHLLANNSLQGIASYYLMKAAKHSLSLTGTLLNGYAANLFYTLFRICPNVMRQEGFTYEDEAEFARLFGVTSRESNFTTNRGYGRTRVGNVKEKRLPGVSPLIFTKFLLNLTSFIALDDMAEGLPMYEEIPVGIDMDEETNGCYQQIEQFFSERVGSFRTGGRKIMGSVIKLMTQYPDAPHCQRRVVDPDTLEVQFESTALPKSIRNKEQKLLEIIQEKVAAGEKVLVYYNTVNTTDLGEHLTAFLCSEDIKAFELRANVKAEKRMDYINKEVKKGAQVMITNPSLVETGLDLLDFTTIIFFQVGYNLSTMRQASRRSWRLSQTKDIQVYFLYYKNTIQEQAISLMATKLQAAQTLEGNFSEEGLKAMSQNEDVLTQIANNVVNDIKTVVDLDAFKSARHVKKESNKVREHKKTIEQIEYKLDSRGQKIILEKLDEKVKRNKTKTYISSSYTNNLLKLFI